MISHVQERIVATGHAVIVMYNFQEICKANIPDSFVRAMSEADSGQNSSGFNAKI